ncbi:unnamed protein product [Phytophthora fragariaefolia]|uniref:Unnamed protein product n=1 Tax=Phytophthora fragariaefolia TaxID=1490495 RepID=A0A9W7CXI8_9STRA|nr:unnamed protein product [Phytophthora fragariaefolia]
MADTLAKLTRPIREAITRYDLDGDLLTYAFDTFDAPRVGVPTDDDLRARSVHEYHDAPTGGHIGREKAFAALSRDFFWSRMYKWIRKWARSCEIWQRMNPAASKRAPLRPLPIATSAWRSVTMEFIFGLPLDADGRTGVLVFADRFSKMVHLAPVAAEVTADESAELFLDLSRATPFTAWPSTVVFFAVDAAVPAASTVAPKPTPTPIDSVAVPELLLHHQAVTRVVFLLSTHGIQGTAVTNLCASKLAPRFIGPFKILKVIGDASTLNIPTAMRLHPTFYVGRLKPYIPVTLSAPEAERPQPMCNLSGPAVNADAESARSLAPQARASPSVARRTRATPSDEAAPLSPVAPAPTESQQHAREQTQRGSEPPSRCPSPGRSQSSSAGTAEPLGAPRRQSARSQAALQQTGTSAMGPRRLWMRRGGGAIRRGAPG